MSATVTTTGAATYTVGLWAAATGIGLYSDSAGRTKATATSLSPSIAVQATATGTVATNYIATTRTTSGQTFTSAGDVILNTTDQSVGSSVTYNTSTGVYTLTAGTTYELSFTPSWTFSGSSNDPYVQYDWVDASTNTALDGNSGSFATAYSYQYNFAQHNFNIISKLVYTPSTNQTVKVRVTATQSGGITTTLATGSSAYVKAISATFALNTLATMDTTGNVSVGGSLTVTGNISATGSVTSGGYTVGYLEIPQNAQNTSYTLALTDSGKHVYSQNTATQVITIPTNANVAYTVGTAISIVLQGSGSITVSPFSGVTLYLAGNSTSASRTISTYGMATLLKVATNTWFINGSGVS
jgi:hypothetical protein